MPETVSSRPEWVPTEVDGPLLTLPPLEFAQLWGELVEAYWGHNGFGGDTAELYSFRFQRYNPTVHMSSMRDGPERDEEEFNHFCGAARTLLSLVQQFCIAYGCLCEIDGVSVEEWADAVACNKHRFRHRAHVRVVHKSES